MVIDGAKVSQLHRPRHRHARPGRDLRRARVLRRRRWPASSTSSTATGELVRQIGMPGVGRARWSWRSARRTCSSTRPTARPPGSWTTSTRSREVNKYEDGVLGGDPPPPPPQPPQNPKPTKSVPGKPAERDRARRATPRRSSPGARPPTTDRPITKYVVEGAGQSITVGRQAALRRDQGPDQRHELQVHRLRGQRHGQRSEGDQPAVIPTADVPDAPTSVTATAKRATAPSTSTGRRRTARAARSRSYAVTSISGGTQAPVGSVTGTTMTIAKGSLTYGTQYAFTVVAVNDRNAGSKSSPVSNTVVPFTAPGAPRNTRRRHGARPAGRRPGHLAGRDRQRAPDHEVRRRRGQGPHRRHRHEHHPDRLRRRRRGADQGARGQRGRARARRERHRPDDRRAHADRHRQRRRLQLRVRDDHPEQQGRRRHLPPAHRGHRRQHRRRGRVRHPAR